MAMTDPRHNNHSQEPGYEEHDMGSRPVYGFLVALVITGVLVYFTVWGMFFGLDKFFSKHQDAMSPMAPQASTPPRMVTTQQVEKAFPDPRLETDERGEINDFRLGEEQTLNSYDWVDQTDGVVRIPITEAMKLVAQRGLPTRSQDAATASPAKPAARQTGKKK